MSPRFPPVCIAVFSHNQPSCGEFMSSRLEAKEKMKSISRFSVRLLVAVGAASGIATADEVTDWNQMMLLAALTAPVTPAPVTTSVAAIVQAAVFDAVNGIDRRYTSIYVPPAATPGASARAAAVQAAYATLVNLYPAQKAKFDQQRT